MLVTSDSFTQAFDQIRAAASIHPVFFVDTETTGLDIFHGARICGVAVGTFDDQWYFPVRHGEGDNISMAEYRELVEFLYSPDFTWYGWNSKFDIRMFLADGFGYPPRFMDVMLAAHLVNENEASFKLKTLGQRFIDPTATDEQEGLAEELKKRGIKKGGMWRLPPELVSPYAEKDVFLTCKLYEYYVPRLHSQDLYNLWLELNQYMMVITKMEVRGMLMDVPQIEANIRQCEEMAKKAYEDLRTLCGYAVNPNSSPQVQKLLGIPSTAVDVLDGMDHPAIPYILDYRRWLKASSTYYQAFLREMSSLNVLHPNINQIGTVTGRQSSSDPNVHAIPRKEEIFEPKELVKQAFIARPGFSLVQCDYKQAEVYLGAHYAQASRLIDMLRQGIDVHTETAKRLGIPRPVAKRLNFAMQYGIGDETLKIDMWKFARIRITLDEAIKYRAAYNRLHPEMKALYFRAQSVAKENGFIKLFTGRRRHYNGLDYSTVNAKGSPYHKASSNLIQGGISEIMRLSSMDIDRNLSGGDVHQLLHVHDSIMLEVRDEIVDEVVPEVVRTMTKLKFTVPLRVEVETGKRWYDLKPWKEGIAVA